MKKNKFHAKADLQLAREREKYEHPVPSREHILFTLSEAGHSLILDDFLELFGIHDDVGKEGVRRRLLAMERDAQIVGTESGAYRVFIKGSDTAPKPRYYNKFIEKVTLKEALNEVISHYELPNLFTDKVLGECRRFGATISEREANRRRDLRDMPFVTIDGEDAKDFDDAVYAERMDNGHFKLFVAIADVSFYVSLNSATDKEALLRGNSVYFPNYVIPMLPEVLSNELCSLKPDVDRLCLVCEMEVSLEGELVAYHFFEAVICSKARLTYRFVADFLSNPDKISEEPFRAYTLIWPHILTFYELYKILHKARDVRGALDFDTVEGALVLNAEGELTEIKPIQRNDAHRMIEEAMLLANVASADFFIKQEIPALYRIHEGVRQEKVDDLRDFFKIRGVALGKNPTTKTLQQLLFSLIDRPDYPIIQTVVLRSLNQAVYSPHNVGHYGLAYTAYTHFTSPIRRYPDLVVHRLIRQGLSKKDQAGFRYDEASLAEVANQTSQTERRADEASRRVATILKCSLVQKHLGETFSGIVSGVTAFGLFLTLDKLLIDGLIHIATLTPQDFYTLDTVHHRLVGEGSGTVFELGQALQVKVVRVNVWERKIDFMLAKKEAGS